MRNTLLTILAVVLGFAAAGRASAATFELVDGDRVILLGSALVERDIQHGYFETLLSCHYHGRNVVFRNLGWSGDTVFADARGGFDPPAKGYERMLEQTRSLAPSCIVVAYGANESFAGSKGLESFTLGLNKLLDTLGETKARMVLFGPPRAEQLGAPLPDPAAHNADLRLYADAIRDIAATRGLMFVDLFELLPDGAQGLPPRPLTDNGLHFTGFGYWRSALSIYQALGLPAADWEVELSRNGEIVTQHRTAITAVETTEDGLRFQALDSQLPAPNAPCEAALSGANRNDVAAPRLLRVAGLPEGRYVLLIDDQEVTAGTEAEWAAGMTLAAGPEFTQVEGLRQTIRRKNELYFHRWRPQNDTYLLGFRKYEQGQNAVEIPQFDPLVAEQEAVIARLRVPVSHSYQLVRKVRPSVEPQARN